MVPSRKLKRPNDDGQPTSKRAEKVDDVTTDLKSLHGDKYTELSGYGLEWATFKQRSPT